VVDKSWTFVKIICQNEDDF